MAAFRVLETQFQKFIKPQISLDDDDVIMTRKYFLEYTQLEVQQFRDTLIQHMEYVKKSIDKRALHKREYDSRVNERQMQTIKEKVDTSKALDASLDETESNIGPIYDEESIAKVPMTADNNVFATRQHHTEQPEFNNEGNVDQDAEKSHDISAAAFPAAVAVVPGCGWRTSHHGRTMWCRAVAAQPLGGASCAQPLDATVAALAEPAVATTTTTAAP
ncbi:hypothetical protein Tco_1387707, partial [Tanacetum coccineum]